MISVIVPVYKVKSYLHKCVESIQKQTYQDLEIILIDDGSPDCCGKICDELAQKDSRIVVVHQKNSGQANARNTGIDIAQGKYLAFVDSDDTIEPQMIEILLTMLTDTGADLAICGHRTVVLEECAIDVNEACFDGVEVLTKRELWQEVFGCLNNAVWNKLYKAELVGNLRFPEGIIHGEDLIFNLEYLARCQKGAINQAPLYNYLKHEGSITGSAFSERKFFEIQSKDWALKLVEQFAPEQVANAQKYCFRARMNVLRSIFKARKQSEYAQEVADYKRYVKENYSRICSMLRIKEKIEYKLFMTCMPIYRLAISGV